MESDKIHLYLGDKTACGIDLFEHDMDCSEELKEVTCGNCLRLWNCNKRKWNKEFEKEQKEKEKNERKRKHNL